MKKYVAYFLIPLLAITHALTYKLFIFPNSFAPSGLDGICTMIQYLLHTNMGYLALIANVPLLIVAWFVVRKSFVIKTILYVSIFSSSIIALDYINVSAISYYTETGTSTVLAPIVAGVIRGVLYVFAFKLGASAGGVDVIAMIIKKYKPHYNIMYVIFTLNVCIAISSYFVYGMNVEPVICSILFAFVCTITSNRLKALKRETIRFEIITDHADEIYAEISATLRQSATIVNARGAHSGLNKQMIICIIEKRRVHFLEDILSHYPDTVTFESTVNTSLYPT